MKLWIALSLGAGLLMGQNRIEVQGHRGARAVLPENTLPAFEYAIRVGADVLELDLAVTKDNILVVSHDAHINNKICTGPDGAERKIRALTLAQLRQWDCGAKANPEFPKQKTVPGTKIPTLEEVLALAERGKFHFNIETKSDPKQPDLQPAPAEFARLVVEAVRKRGLATRVVIQSFDWRTIDEVKKLAPEIRVAALHPAGMADAVLKLDYVKAMHERGYPIASPHYRFVSKDKVAQAHQLGMKVVPWTANDAKVWDNLLAAGVDGIITDDPAALIEYLKSKGLR